MRWVGHLHVWLMGVVCLWGAPLYADNQYKITGVERSDSLNIRAEPGAKAAVVSKIPHDGNGIVLQGGSRQIGKTNWVNISWQGHAGWVSETYLQLVPGEGGSPAGKDEAEKAEKANPQKSAAGGLTEKPDKDKTSAAQADSAEDTAGSVTKTPVAGQAEVTSDKAKSPSEPAKTLQKEKISGMWILECGSMSPFWKVEVLPEWMSGTLGKHKTGMPITYKKQEHGKYRNIALKTEVKGANRWNRLELALTYDKSCLSTLTRRRVAFHVTGRFNDTTITGCCRALQVK